MTGRAHLQALLRNATKHETHYIVSSSCTATGRGGGQTMKKIHHLGSEQIQTPPWQHRNNGEHDAVTSGSTAYHNLRCLRSKCRTRHRDEHPSISWSGRRHIVPQRSRNRHKSCSGRVFFYPRCNIICAARFSEKPEVVSRFASMFSFSSTRLAESETPMLNLEGSPTSTRGCEGRLAK
jgi:hypothetical protein